MTLWIATDLREKKYFRGQPHKNIHIDFKIIPLMFINIIK